MVDSTQQIPEQEALLVELPGVVRNTDAALDSFGGQDAISELLGGGKEALQLKLRPGDPLAHPIMGLKQPAKGLLLKLSQKPGTSRTAHACNANPFAKSNSHTVHGHTMRHLVRPRMCAGQAPGEGVQAEVVAHVRSSVRFRGMADFQYMPCDTRPKDAQVRAPTWSLLFAGAFITAAAAVCTLSYFRSR